MEKCGNFLKNCRFSGRIWPDWGNAARADMAGLGSIGLIDIQRGLVELVGQGHVDCKYDLLPPQITKRIFIILKHLSRMHPCRNRLCCRLSEVVLIILPD